MIQSVKNTLNRLFGKIHLWNPIEWFPKLLEGLSVEFGRIRDYKNNVLSATVANTNMTSDAIEDYNKKYGIPNTLGGTNAEQIARIVEKASLTGWPGKQWLEDQIQMAGFQLYVFENSPLLTSVQQYGSGVQYSSLNQYGLTSRFTDPSTYLGELVVGSTPESNGKKILAQYGGTGVQYGSYQYGQPDPTALNPQPKPYEFTTDQGTWGYYFILSPSASGPVTLEAQFLTMTDQEFDYLKNLIIELKLQRNWCILQAKAV
jgi:hypothetical protein